MLASAELVTQPGPPGQSGGGIFIAVQGDPGRLFISWSSMTVQVPGGKRLPGSAPVPLPEPLVTVTVRGAEGLAAFAGPIETAKTAVAMSRTNFILFFTILTNIIGRYLPQFGIVTAI